MNNAPLSLNDYLVAVLYGKADDGNRGHFHMLLSAPLDFVPLLDRPYEAIAAFIQSSSYRILGETNLRKNRYSIDKCAVINKAEDNCICLLFFKSDGDRYFFSSYGRITDTCEPEPAYLFQILHLSDTLK